MQSIAREFFVEAKPSQNERVIIFPYISSFLSIHLFSKVTLIRKRNVTQERADSLPPLSFSPDQIRENIELCSQRRHRGGVILRQDVTDQGVKQPEALFLVLHYNQQQGNDVVHSLRTNTLKTSWKFQEQLF